jgi:hypothetical protein
MTEIFPPLGKYKYDTWRILLVKYYIDNSVHLRSCILNTNNDLNEARARKLYLELTTRANDDYKSLNAELSRKLECKSP